MNVSLAPNFGKPLEKSGYQKAKIAGKWAAVTAALGAVGYTAATGVAAMGEHYHLWHANHTVFPCLNNPNSDLATTSNNDHIVDDLKKDLAQKDNVISEQKETIDNQKMELVQEKQNHEAYVKKVHTELDKFQKDLNSIIEKRKKSP